MLLVLGHASDLVALADLGLELYLPTLAHFSHAKLVRVNGLQRLDYVPGLTTVSR
jgi:hypothetical protein